jgi:hypothetical protein
LQLRGLGPPDEGVSGRPWSVAYRSLGLDSWERQEEIIDDTIRMVELLACPRNNHGIREHFDL